MPVSLLDLSAEELIDRGIAPIKKEYRLGAIRYRQTRQEAAGAADPTAAAQEAAAASTGAPGAADTTADDALEAEGPAAAGADQSSSRSAPAVAADGEGGHKRTKSKRQRKKERAAASGERLCFQFLLNRCRYGPGCKYSHDLEAYMASKPPDLPGPCPYSNQPECPYHATCRWAGSHRSVQPLQQEQAEPAEAGAAVTVNGVQQEQQQQQQGAVPLQQQQQGEVPQQILIEPFTQVLAPINAMSRDMQQVLWKKQYDFSRAAQTVKDINRLMGNGGGNNSSKGQQRQQQQQQQSGDGGHAAKRQKLDPAGAAAAAGDTVMADAPPAAVTAAVTAAAAAAVAAADGEDELDYLYASGVPVTPQNSLVQHDAAVLAAAGAGGAASGLDPDPAHHQLSDASLIAALQQEQAQQQQQQQQTEAAVGCAVGSSAGEPRSRPCLDISGKSYLAPLTTVGNLPFRRMCVDLGCEVTCGEMSLAVNLLQGQMSEWALLKRHPCEKLFGVQVCGGYTDQMSQVAQLLDDQLGDNIDFLDINCGCPIDVICSKGAGSSLLLRPRRLEEVVRAVTGCIAKPVIVKLRKGYYDATDVAHDIIPQLPGWGAAAVTLHGRSRQQRYSRAADWNYIRRCARIASSVGLPLIGNGDVFSPQEWQQRLAAAAAEPEEDGTEGGCTAAAAAAAGASGGCGVSTAMIGRAALIKPWIFTEIAEGRLWDISASERLDLVKSYVSYGLENWGSDSKGVESTRRFLLEWLSFTHRYIPVGLLEVVPQVMSWRPPAYATRNQLEGLLSSDSAADWLKISEMFLGPAPEGFTFVPKHKSSAYTLTADALAQLVGAAAGSTAAAAADEDEGEENG